MQPNDESVAPNEAKQHSRTGKNFAHNGDPKDSTEPKAKLRLIKLPTAIEGIPWHLTNEDPDGARNYSRDLKNPKNEGVFKFLQEYDPVAYQAVEKILSCLESGGKYDAETVVALLDAENHIEAANFLSLACKNSQRKTPDWKNCVRTVLNWKRTPEGIAILREAMEAAGLPVIETNDRQQTEVLGELCYAILKANEKHPFLFRSYVGLVSIGSDATEQARMKSVGRAALVGMAGEAARWISTTKREGIRDVSPSRDLCEVYLSTEKYWHGVPFLDSTASTPFYAADGTLCDTTGYHHAARVWLQLPKNFRLGGTRPTPENVAAAKHLILQKILGEVSFADDASRAHAVALMLLPFVRLMIDGPTPLHLGNAPLRGTGKTYALQLCVLPFTTPILTPEKGTEEEWRKSIICELSTGPSHFFLDNVKKNLNSATLDAVITSPSGFIRERLTGTGQMVTASTRCVWVATANNAQLTEDAATRSIVIQLDTNEENPDQRAFKHDPREFIIQNRAEVVTAILTLVQAWIEAGRPDYAGKHSCRFKAWQRVMGGILDVVGIPGFLGNLQTQREAIGANAGSEWHEFTEAWFKAHSTEEKTAADLLPLAVKIPEFATHLDSLNEAARSKKLAQWIAGKRDRVFSSLKIKIAGEIDRKRSFKIEKIEKPQPKYEPEPEPDICRTTELTELPTVKARNETKQQISTDNGALCHASRLYANSSVSSVSSVNGSDEGAWLE